MKKAIINARIYDYKNYYDDSYIIFDNKILEIGKMSSYKNKDYHEIDGKDSFVLPGLISGHTHLYSTFARGMNSSFNPENFMDILKQLWWKLDYFLDEDDIYFSALMGGLDQLKCGTTTLIDHHASKLVKKSLEKIRKALIDDLNIRAILAFETSDRFNVMDAINENSNFIKNNHNDKVSGLFGMHASISLSDSSLKEIKDNLGNEGIHIHVAESIMDEEDSLIKYGMRVVERLDKFGLINDKSLLVHCTHIDDFEMDIIKKRNATIAINVTSNLNNAVGISNVKKFLDKGIRVIAGNDGLIQSQAFEYLNIYYLGHLKEKSPTGFSLDNVLTIINNTYDYINMLLGTKLGSISVNSEADLLLVDYNNYSTVNENNVFGHIFYGTFPCFKPRVVIASGNVLIENYKIEKNELNQLYIEALSQAEKLWDRIKKEGENIEFKY
ncbi:MAG: amidohydrolase family protein [Candidatus Izemoplasmatales bacterium]|nr:amidohydrolase family protein [Candidatus Izemoplasmatales bacterium]